MAKEGSTVGGLMDCFGTAISMCLQYGVPLEVLVNKFSHTRFEPMGHTTNPDIRIAKSVVDYIFRWLGITFLAGYREARSGRPAGEKPDGGGAGHRRAWPGRRKTSNGHAAVSGNGSANGHGRAGRKADLEVLERAGGRRDVRAANSSPASRATPRPATTAVPSPSATATATSATTAATAWAAPDRSGPARARALS